MQTEGSLTSSQEPAAGLCPQVDESGAHTSTLFPQAEAKAVPLHATEALVGRGRIAPTHSRLRH
jgi:hypothetical protein